MKKTNGLPGVILKKLKEPRSYSVLREDHTVLRRTSFHLKKTKVKFNIPEPISHFTNCVTFDDFYENKYNNNNDLILLEGGRSDPICNVTSQVNVPNLSVTSTSVPINSNISNNSVPINSISNNSNPGPSGLDNNSNMSQVLDNAFLVGSDSSGSICDEFLDCEDLDIDVTQESQDQTVVPVERPETHIEFPEDHNYWATTKSGRHVFKPKRY